VNIEHLREFIVLGTIRNFTAAARKLGLSQSTLSKHLASIEREANLTLLERSTNRVDLTPQGKAFLEGAMMVVDHYDTTLRNAVLASTQNNAKVLVGGSIAGMHVNRLLLITGVMLSRAANPVVMELFGPHASTSLLERAAHDAGDLLREGILDAAILEHCSEVDRWTGFERQVLYRDPFVVLVHKDDPVAQKDTLSAEDLQNHRLLIPIGYPYLARRIMDLAAEMGRQVPLVTRVLDHAADVLASMQVGDVICTARANSEVIANLDSTGVVALDVDRPREYVEVCLVYPRNTENPAVGNFVDALTEVAAAHRVTPA